LRRLHLLRPLRPLRRLHLLRPLRLLRLLRPLRRLRPLCLLYFPQALLGQLAQLLLLQRTLMHNSKWHDWLNMNCNLNMTFVLMTHFIMIVLLELVN
jgi:hypothetical protein